MLNYKCWYYETAKAAGTTAVPKAMKTEDVPEDVRLYKEKYDKMQSPAKSELVRQESGQKEAQKSTFA